MKTILAILITAFLFVSLTYKYDEIIKIEDGVGIKSIKLGEKCSNEVRKEFGKGFNKSKSIRIGHLPEGGGFREMCTSYDYTKLGVKFNFIETTLSYQKGAFLTEIMFYNNFQCITSKGIVLGKSSFLTAVEQYGKSQWNILYSESDFVAYKVYLGMYVHFETNKCRGH